MSTLVQLLQDSVNTQPEAEAIVYKDRRVSYHELWVDVCSIAGHLRNKGLKIGDRVGIYVENSPEYIAIYYGVLAAGGVAVGLNTAAKARDNIKFASALRGKLGVLRRRSARTLTDCECLLTKTCVWSW